MKTVFFLLAIFLSPDPAEHYVGNTVMTPKDCEALVQTVAPLVFEKYPSALLTCIPTLDKNA